MPDIKIQSLEGSQFDAYCSMPASGNGPGLIVIHAVSGLNESARKLCDDFAAQGYVTVCPDLFWRQQDAVNSLHEGHPANSFNVEPSVRDLIAVLAHVRKIPGCNGKVGALGFCLGSRLAYLMATRSDIDASVCYYATGIDKHLDEIHDIREPVIVHMAALDEFSTPSTNEKIRQIASRNPHIKIFVYENAKHAFASEDGVNFDKNAAELAKSRTNDFLSSLLQK